MDHAQLYQYIDSVPLLACTELSEGPAAVQGRTVVARPLVSPVSGIAAACYLVEVRALLRDGSQRTKVITAVEPFQIHDGNGAIAVEPRGGWLLLAHEYAQSDDQLPSASVAVLRLLRQHGEESWLPEVTSFAWRESFLEPGEICFACGSVRLQLDSERQPVHYRETAYRPCLVAASPRPLIIADQSRDSLLASCAAAAGAPPPG